MLNTEEPMTKKDSIFNIIADIRNSEFTPVNIDSLTLSDLQELVLYLKASHEFYTQICFPKLHEAIHAMLKKCDRQVSDVMNRFFDEYEKDVRAHFEYEEKILFPCATALAKGNPVGKIEHGHASIVTSLKDMKSLVINHIPYSECSEDKINVLSYIFRLEEDLGKHVLIEERLFIPLVKKFKKSDR